MRKSIRCDGRFSAENVDRLRSEASAFLQAERVPGPQAYSIITVVDEVACNILEHAGAGFLELEIRTGLATVELLFRDDGAAFDPTEKIRQQAAMMPGDSQERKLGLYMVASLGDGLRYERHQGLNELTLVIPSEGPRDEGAFAIETEPAPPGKAWKLRLRGKLDVFSFVKLKTSLEEITERAPGARLAVDLGGVDYIASSGWSVLLARRKLGRAAGGDLVICGMGAEIRRVYDSMRIAPLLPSFPDLASAVQRLELG